MQSNFSIESDQTIKLSVRKLRIRYTVALSLIAALVLFSQFIMQSQLTSQGYDANVINIAGRQRMLSQKITKLSYYILTAASPAKVKGYQAELKDAVDIWENSHLGLIYGNDELALPGENSREISQLFDEIAPHYIEILSASKLLLSPSNSSEIQSAASTISRHEADFLRLMNQIVFLYAKEAKDKVSFAESIEIALMFFTLFILILEYIFIFSPAARSLQSGMNRLAQNQKDLQNLFAASPIAMLLVDPQNFEILQVNTKGVSLIGDPFVERKNALLTDYLDSNYENNRSFIEKLKTGKNLNEHEIAILNTQGSINETLISVRNVTFDSKPMSVIGITNISELKKAQAELFHHASFDDMTDLLNRRAGLIFLNNAMQKVEENNKNLAICFIDLDGLKTVNDQYGHAEGDWLIQTTSEVLNELICPDDAGIRLGGDEFLLVLHDCSITDVERFVARIENHLEKLNSTHGKPFSLSFSYGITLYDASRNVTADELISESDDLMYQFKQAKKQKAEVNKSAH